MCVTSGTSWFFDFGCCNHMTSDSTIFTSKNPVSYTSSINTADGSQLHVSLIGTISTYLSLPTTFHILKLTINLIYVCQMCDLGLNVLFSSSSCHLQDPRTSQIIGIGRKVRRMFELIHLRTPPTTIVAYTPPTPPLNMWHSRLGHVSFKSTSISCAIWSVKVNKV